MKLRTLTLVCLIALCSSCSDNPTDPTGMKGSMSAVVKGAAWSANKTAVAVKSGNTLTITGLQSGGGKDRKVQLILSNPKGKSYQFTDSPNSAIFIEVPEGAINGGEADKAKETAKQGGVDIIEQNDQHVKGNFSFTTDKNTSVSGGSFDIQF